MDRFEDSFERLFVCSYRAAARIVGAADAEDIAAEALSRAYLAWRKLDGLDHQTAWVLRVTTNLAIDSVRRRRAGAHLAESAIANDPTGELRGVLVPLLRQLPRRQREVVALRHLVDLTEAEIADLLGISTGAVKQHLHRALGRLRSTAPADLQEATA